MVCVALTASSAVGGATLTLILTWYVIASGLGYAGRLPIHIVWGGYVCLRPRETAKPGLRKRLNLLTFLNFLSALAWLGVGVLFLEHPAMGLPLRCLMTILLYLVVVLLAADTVDTTSSLGLRRGTEIVCESPIGRRFKALLPRVPADSPLGRLMKWLSEPSPRHQVSSFLLLAAAALIAMPSGAYSAETMGRKLRDLSPGAGAPEQAVGTALPVTRETTATAAAEPSVEAGPSSQPTYDDVCAGAPSPGFPAPSPQRDLLYGLWLGGSGLEGAGAIEAGCAQPARPVPGHPEVWYARGNCGDSLRSLGVAAPGYLPSLIYQPAAEFALRQAEQGTLLGASPRRRIGSGDLYVVDTAKGSFALVRRHTSTAAGAGVDPLSCEQVATGSVAYTIVPPGLVGLWLEIASTGWVWPTPADPVEPQGSDFVFRADGPAGPPVASAHCDSEVACTANFDGRSLSTEGSLFTSIAAIEAAAG